MDRASRAEQQWKKECPELSTESMVIFGRLGELYQLVSQKVLAPNFADFGLQPGEFDVLATLRRSGEPYTLAPTELYQTAMISSGSMTNRLDHLAKAGLVERLPNPKDKRGNLVKLTTKGRAVIDAAIVPHIDNQTDILAVLSSQEREQLSSMLLKLVHRVDPQDVED